MGPCGTLRLLLLYQSAQGPATLGRNCKNEAGPGGPGVLGLKGNNIKGPKRRVPLGRFSVPRASDTYQTTRLISKDTACWQKLRCRNQPLVPRPALLTRIVRGGGGSSVTVSRRLATYVRVGGVEAAHVTCTGHVGTSLSFVSATVPHSLLSLLSSPLLFTPVISSPLRSCACILSSPLLFSPLLSSSLLFLCHSVLLLGLLLSFALDHGA